ncbi:MAG TPA: hypothetical protein VJ046_00605 [Candidatus Paceibacterota bacterium]|nr:hypothetical protein [Candidatus Paceibacterota bacterium]
MPETGPSLEQEITQLEKQLAEKRAALDQVETKDSEPSEKEVLHSVVGERIQQQAPQYRPRQGGAKPQDEDEIPSYTEQELKEKVQELVNVVFNKSLEEGIKEVSRSNNPALIDAFHDVLVDQLYALLLERKKLEPVK